MSSIAMPRKRRQRKTAPPSTKQGRRQPFDNAIPPELQITPAMRHVFRFQSSSTLTNVALTLGNFAGICGCYCTTANTLLKFVASSVKIHRISIFTASGGTSSIEWLYPLNYMGPDRESLRDMPTGLTTPSRFTTSPPSDSLASDWANTNLGSSTAMVNITTLQGSVIDVDISWTTKNVYDNSYTSGVTTATLNSYYYLPLDGTTTHLLGAIGLPTTF
jgi:hypothetical protein